MRIVISDVRREEIRNGATATEEEKRQIDGGLPGSTDNEEPFNAHGLKAGAAMVLIMPIEDMTLEDEHRFKVAVMRAAFSKHPTLSNMFDDIIKYREEARNGKA